MIVTLAIVAAVPAGAARTNIHIVAAENSMLSALITKAAARLPQKAAAPAKNTRQPIHAR
jgi:hypothetical protein